MTPIIAGRFEQEAQAEAAVAALRHAGFDAADVTTFFVNPAGQHATYPIGGDRDASPGAKHAHTGALKGAAVGTAVGVGVGVAGGVCAPEGLVAVGSTVRGTLRDGVGVGWGVWGGEAGAGDGEAVLGTVSTGTGAAVTPTVQFLVSIGGTLRMSGMEQASLGQTWKTIV